MAGEKHFETERLYEGLRAREDCARRSPGLSFFFNESGLFRLGIAAGKKLGKSHDRNKIRRRIREIARGIQGEIAAGVDLVVVAKARGVKAKFEELNNEFVALAKKSGFLKAKN